MLSENRLTLTTVSRFQKIWIFLFHSSVINDNKDKKDFFLHVQRRTKVQSNNKRIHVVTNLLFIRTILIVSSLRITSKSERYTNITT